MSAAPVDPELLRRAEGEAYEAESMEELRQVLRQATGAKKKNVLS